MTSETKVNTANKKKKEFFSLGLYVEAVKRIRLPGIILSVILALEALLVPLGFEIDYLMTKRMYGGEAFGSNYTPQVMSGSELHILLFLVAVVGAPVFAWSLFSFLNKRSASDYYHSLPHTRLSLYVSNIAALVSWIFGITVVTSGLSRFTAALFPKVISVEAGTYFPYMAGCFALSLLIAACIVIGKSITGTVFSNLVVTSLIMVFPRFVMAMVTSAVTSKLPIIPADHVSFFLSPKLNILTGMITQLEDVYYVESCLFDGVSQIYTLVLALAYFALGAFLFCRRKSESAQRSAPSKRMQAVYRTVLAFAVSVPFCYIIFGLDNDPISKVFLVGALVILSALTYFIYEILTTKKWKNLLRAIPGFFIVLLLDVLLFGTMYGITALEGSFRPDASEIKYVQLAGNTYGYAGMGMDFRTYVESETSKLKITDEEAIKTVAKCLDETFEYYETYGGIDDWYSYSHNGAYSDKAEYASIYTFRIVTKSGITKYRNIRFYSEDMATVRESLGEMSGYSEAWTTLPTPHRGTLTMDSGAFEISNDQAEEIFEVFKSELEEVDLDKWVEFNMSYGPAFAYFYYQTADIYLSVPVSAELFPETADMILKYAKINADEIFKEIESALENYENSHLQYAELLVYENGNYVYCGTDTSFFDEDRTEFVLSCRDSGKFELGDDFMRVEIEFFDTSDGEEPEKGDMVYLSCIIKVSEESKEILSQYYKGVFED
ncbi:MAG: APC family permease [Clostridia bacterium]|nr:APC family permease [Clostridia bacterium]